MPLLRKCLSGNQKIYLPPKVLRESLRELDKPEMVCELK
jgi:hypothetical protein